MSFRYQFSKQVCAQYSEGSLAFTSFDDVRTVQGQRDVSIKEIAVWTHNTENIVSAMQITYQKQGRYLGSSTDVKGNKHGLTSRNCTRTRFQFSVGEQLLKVEASLGQPCISALTFITNFRQVLVGKPCRSQATLILPPQYEFLESVQILGFYGAYTTAGIHRLGVFAIPCRNQEQGKEATLENFSLGEKSLMEDIPNTLLGYILKFLNGREIKKAACVCKKWKDVCSFAAWPMCGQDLKLRAEGSCNLLDGEFTLYALGDRAKPFQAFCIDLQTDNPKVYLKLPRTSHPTHHEVDAEYLSTLCNFSYFPAGGTADGSSVLTWFAGLRLDPYNLKVKTDDMLYSSSSGSLLFRYWNNKRIMQVESVPYATARCCKPNGFADDLPGVANIDLRGTPFAIASKFARMGFSSYGTLSAEHGDQVMNIKGGGFAGRVVPEQDVTSEDPPTWPDHANEGRNGGWVLELKIFSGPSLSWTVHELQHIADCQVTPSRAKNPCPDGRYDVI
ncbi:hypothetical protein CYMTET_15461 [Cymbomonas tetramitiformis]|uniref:F-box domain-containing protein n=1 Tax=Cymbomonas tetramitiformis TaxID=36881 RepID=A0AAE0GEE4_9CHLO|nr:hypothetical protein CYMTET_15461 [Cymbomonas tetramitiformis]